MAIESVTDLNGNTNSNEFAWKFIAQPQECGRAEFVAGRLDSTLVVNQATSLVNGMLGVGIFNPDQDAPAWELNARVQAINLLYRPLGSPAWIPAGVFAFNV